MTTTDTRIDTVALTLRAMENSRTSIRLNYSGGVFASMNDVKEAYTARDVEYEITHTDRGLTDAYELYKSNIFDPNMMDNIKNQNLNGIYEEQGYSIFAPKPYEIDAPTWLDLEAKMAVKEITEDITNDVHLDPNINYMTYPIPSDLLKAARDDLIMKIERNEIGYVNKDYYWNNNLYSSASAKVISVIREWYVDEVKYMIKEKFTKASEQISTEISKNFSSPVTDANRNATSFLSEGMNLPIGLAMSAYHVDADGNKYPADNISAWNESVTLSINQEPNYLDEAKPHPSNPRLYTLKVRNNNILGGTGVHVLPTLDPWITTFNMWSIDVEGEFVKFEVQDIDNEVHPDPIFGHAAQVYVRRELPVEDPLNNNVPIGDNLPIKFSFTTGTFIAVPPGKLTGVGDKDWVIIEESPGWKI